MKFATALFSLISAVSASCIHGTSLYPRAAEGTVSSFNYTGIGGPLNWYGLDRQGNAACATGKTQSPIDIDTGNIGYASPKSLKFNIPKARRATLENLGYGLEVALTNGTLVVNNMTYTVAQFHFHTPSEHWIDGEYFPMEVHFVFQSSDGSLAVVGFLFELSESRLSSCFPLFDSVFARINELGAPGTHTETGVLDFAALTAHLNAHPIYQYSGSLTTPPCSEGVSWFVSSEPLPLNVKVYNAAKRLIKYNARYIQNTPGQDNLLQVAARNLN